MSASYSRGRGSGRSTRRFSSRSYWKPTATGSFRNRDYRDYRDHRDYRLTESRIKEIEEQSYQDISEEENIFQKGLNSSELALYLSGIKNRKLTTVEQLEDLISTIFRRNEEAEEFAKRMGLSPTLINPHSVEQMLKRYNAVYVIVLFSSAYNSRLTH